MFDRLAEFIFPKTCAICNHVGDWLCPDCKKKLQPHQSICLYCHQQTKNFQTCKSCKISNPNAFLDGCIIAFGYNDYIKKLIMKLKYYHRKSVKGFLGQQLFFCIISNEEIGDQVKASQEKKLKYEKIYITAVASHWRRHYFVKGYNQSILLAQEISKISGLKFDMFLHKIKNTKSQVHLDRSSRQKNIFGVFEQKENDILEGNETIIIIDDITTTGSTLNETARTLKLTYPNLKIRGAVVARNNK